MTNDMLRPARGDQVRSDDLRRKLEMFVTLSVAEAEYISALERVKEGMPAGTDIVRDGEPFGDIYFLKKGWAVRYKTLENGSRAIINFMLPGDFVSLNAPTFNTSDHSITTITDITAVKIAVEQFVEMVKWFPKLSLAFTWFGAREEANLTERLLSMGRRPASQKLAHLLLELWRRQEVLDLPGDEQFVLPVAQVHLADSLGMSVVHVNRILRHFRERNLVRIRRGSITLVDVGALDRIADFDPAYLHLEQMPSRTRRALANTG